MCRMRMSLVSRSATPLKGSSKQAARAIVERERHGVDGEVAAAQVFVDGGGRNDWRLAGLFVTLRPGHADFGAGVAGERNVDGAGVLFDGGNFCASFFEVLLELEGIALNGEIQVADGEAADDVTDGAAGQVEIHARGAGYILHQSDALQLVRRQPEFHRVNVISHSFSSGLQAVVLGAIRLAATKAGLPLFHTISTGRNQQVIQPLVT